MNLVSRLNSLKYSLNRLKLSRLLAAYIGLMLLNWYLPDGFGIVRLVVSWLMLADLAALGWLGWQWLKNA